MLGIEHYQMRDPHCYVLPANWPAVQVFLRCQTQWRTGPAGLLGLDYGPLQWTMQLMDVDDPLDCLGRIQVIEAAVLEWQGSERKRAKKKPLR